MSLNVRTATLCDLEDMVPLLLADARLRQAADPGLWRLKTNAAEVITDSVRAALTAEDTPVRPQWLLAVHQGRVVGLAHSILLPVPPIYAGDFGPPGLIMETCCVAEDAAPDTRAVLLAAAEDDLTAAGAEVLLVSSVTGGAWEPACTARGYAPLTRYYVRTGLRQTAVQGGVRPARADDVDAIVASSADNRRLLHFLAAFWKPHDAADSRFGAWMHKSLTLADRDMFVAEEGGIVTGYAISQPVTPLHIPPGHEIAATGVIDDFYHTDLRDPDRLRGGGRGAAQVFEAAEAALCARGNVAALVVCPAAWTSKTALLDAAGYAPAITWFKKT